MSEEPESLVLRVLRRLDEKMDRLTADVSDLKMGVTSVGNQLAAMAATQASNYASLSSRLDRVERRFDLVGAQP
ncbi:MAG TPA: hypothetical protein VEY31_04740 [Roseococcus sp.]|nr:hypothetical protein [Roseococcus sp.]